MGAHEPPTNRSFYISVATSTLRFAIIVALVVGGILLINQAFPEGATSTLPGGSPQAVSPSPSSSPTHTPKPKPSPTIVGVRLGVYNGTTVTGLAAQVMSTLQQKYGYVAQAVGNTPAPVAQTTLYYRTARDKVEAQALAHNFFKHLDVQITKLQPGTDIPKQVQVAIYLGNDYAATKTGQ
jgi:hypothetical protein